MVHLAAELCNFHRLVLLLVVLVFLFITSYHCCFFELVKTLAKGLQPATLAHLDSFSATSCTLDALIAYGLIVRQLYHLLRAL